jgi:hypothetical protein
MVSPLAGRRPDPARRTSRPPPPPRQEYQEFILQRIEEYKNALTREDLLAIGDEAVRELEGGGGGDQYLLTEVLLLEHVDRIIQRRLRLPSFPRWRQQHRALREAQREPTHWGLEAKGALARYGPRLDSLDVAVVVGAGALSAALYLAAHDAEVLLLDQDLGAVESAEQRAVTEQLSRRFQALVVRFGGWMPDVAPTLVVLDPACLSALPARERGILIQDLQLRTLPGGVHIALPAGEPRQVISLTPEALRRHYDTWQVEGRKRGGGMVAVKADPVTTRRPDTGMNV